LSEHETNGSWRERGAAALFAHVEALNETLDHIEDNLDLFRYLNDTEAMTALRGIRGLLRTKRDDLKRDAEMLYAEIPDGPKA